MSAPQKTILTALAEASPETDFKHLDCFVLLSTQRTGSTLVCKDLESTGAFGVPGEHLLWLTRMFNKRGAVPTMDEFLSRGRSGSGNMFAINIMANQLIYLGAWLASPEEALPLINTPRGSRKLAISALQKLSPLFGATYLVSLKRDDIFATTFSRLKARATQDYHRADSGPDTGPKDSPSLEFSTFEILQEMTSIERSYIMNADALELATVGHMAISYDDAAENFPDYLKPVMQHCNLDPALSSRAKRSLKKVVSGTELKDQKDSFLSRIGFLTE
ncbi:MAG: hypothetical protein CMK07_03170 [Ponticaulis sp.]|nr:hypothetical protein [Ponticaulis sp.]